MRSSQIFCDREAIPHNMSRSSQNWKEGTRTERPRSISGWAGKEKRKLKKIESNDLLSRSFVDQSYLQREPLVHKDPSG